MSESVVVDASVALSWVLPGEASEKTISLRNRAVAEPAMALLVPPTFWYEVANVLWVGVRRQRLERGNAAGVLKTLAAFGFQEWAPDPGLCLALAIDKGIAVYDAAYLQLAMDSRSRLWTLDRLLSRVAATTGVETEPSQA